MKKAFLLLCTLLLVLGCALPLAAYHLTRAVLGPAVSTVRLPLSSPESTASAPEISAAYAGDADRFLMCLLYASPSPRDCSKPRMPSSA